MYKIDGVTVGSANSGTGSSTTRSKYWSDLDRTPITSSRNRSSDKPASNLTNSSSNGSHRTYDSNSYRSPSNREYVVKHAPNSSSGLGLSHNGGNYIRRDPSTANGSLSTSATGLGIPSSSSQARRGYPDRTSHRSWQNNAGRTAVGPSGTASGSVNGSYKKKLEENASGEGKRNLSSGLAAQNDRLEKLLNKSAAQYSRSALNGPSGSENNTSDTMSPPFRATRVVFGTRWRQQADILGDPRAPSSASPKNTYRSFVSCTLRVLTNPSRPLGVFRESQDEEKEQFNPRVKPIVPIHPIHKPSVRIIPIINSEPHSPVPPPAEGSSDKFKTHETTDPVPKNHVRIIPIRIQTEEKENLTQHRTSIKVERKSQSGTSKVYVIPVRTSEVKSEKGSQPRVRIIPIEREVSPEKRTRPEDELEEFGCGSSTETLVSHASMDANNNKDSKCKDKAQTARDFDLFMAELKAEGLLPKRAEEADRESAEFGTKKGLFTVHEEDGPPSVHPRLKHVKRTSATYSLSPSPSPQSSPAPPRRRRTGESPIKSPSPTRKSGSASSFVNLSHSSSSTPSWKTSMSRQSSTSSMMNGVSKSSSFVTADLSPSPSDLHFGPTSKSSSFSSADLTSSYPTSKSNSFDSNHGNQSRSSSGATTVKSTTQCSQRSPSQRRKSPTPKSTSVKMASPMFTRKSPPKSPTLSRRGSLPRNSPLKTGRSPSPSPSSPKPPRARVSPTKTFASANMRPSQVIRSASASTTASAGTEGPVLRSTSAHTADQWAQSQTKPGDPQPVYDPLGRLDSIAETFKEEGNTHYKAKEYAKAFSCYTRAIELCPQNASYYGNRSACLMMMMNYAAALADARESVRLDPNFTKGYIRMAKCNLVMGDAAAAISSLTRAQELDPKNSVIINDYKDVESFQKAEDELHKAVAKHDYRLALYRVELALQHATACARLKLLKAEIFVLLGRYREADDIACDALRKDPNSADAMLIKGMVYYYQDNVEKAFQVFAQVLRFAPDHKKASEIYKKAKLLKAKKEEGNNAFKSGHLQQAYDTYSTAMKIDSANKLTNSKLYFNRSLVSVKLNKLEDAIVDCTEAIKLDESYIKPYLRRAKCYMDSEKFEEAIRDYETVNKMDKCPQNKRLLQEAKLALKKSQRKDYYKILGLDRNANEDEIKKAYKKRALVHHPDRHSSASEHERKEQEKKFKELGEAYGVLSDAKKRARYDNGHDLEDMDVGGFHNDVDPNHIFQAFFGGAFRGGNMGGQGGFGGHPGFNF